MRLGFRPGIILTVCLLVLMEFIAQTGFAMVRWYTPAEVLKMAQ
jgi:hypothetical protein